MSLNRPSADSAPKKLHYLNWLLLLFGLVACAPLIWSGIQVNLASATLINYWLSPEDISNPDRLELVLNRLQTLDAPANERFAPIQQRLDGKWRWQNQDEFQTYLQFRTMMRDSEEGKVPGDLAVLLDENQSHWEPAYTAEANLALASRYLESDEIESSLQVLENAFGASGLPIHTNSCQDWHLEGVTSNTYDLALDAPVHLTLAWRAPNAHAEVGASLPISVDASDSQWMTWSWEDKLIQAATVPNLIVDGGFEHQLTPGARMTAQLPQMLYRGQSSAHSVAEYADDTREGLVLRLTGDDETAVGIASTQFSHNSDSTGEAYLLTGKYRTSMNADPRIGFQWQTTDGTQPNGYLFVVDTPSTEWQTFYALIAPPVNRDAFSIWILNREASGFIDVDQVGLFHVPLPC